jgi:hypothetical protein
MKKFALFMAAGTQGLLDEAAARVTIRGYMRTFFALWRRHAVKIIPPEVRMQVVAYFDSLDLASVVPLTLAKKPKPIADPLDLDEITRAAYQDTTIFRTNRMRVQFIYVNELAALTSERPGAIMESSGYRHSNEALWWSDHEFLVIPNPREPLRPFIAVIVCIRLHKGHRNDPAFFKWIMLFMEPFANRTNCPVTHLLYLAFQDQVFTDITTIEEPLFPTVAPTAIHKLAIRPEHLSTPVLRAEVFDHDLNAFIISPTQALRSPIHGEYLRRLTTLMGYVSA